MLTGFCNIGMSRRDSFDRQIRCRDLAVKDKSDFVHFTLRIQEPSNVTPRKTTGIRFSGAPRFFNMNLLVIILIVLLLAGGGGGYYLGGPYLGGGLGLVILILLILALMGKIGR